MHQCVQLPHADLPWPTDGRPFHAHFSPPCPCFSSSKTRGWRTAPDERDRSEAETLIEWSLRVALSCGATTWSLEQVNSQYVRTILESVRTKHPTRVAWAVFQFRDLGVPQTRVRILAGPPALIRKLLRLLYSQPRQSVREAFGGQVPASLVRNNNSSVGRRKRPRAAAHDSTYVYTKASLRDHCYTVDGPAPTVLAGNGNIYWVSQNGKDTHRRMLTHREAAVLQTFPSTYKLPNASKFGQRVVGNAVPPLVAKLIVQCALELYSPTRPASPSLRWVRPVSYGT